MALNIIIEYLDTKIKALKTVDMEEFVNFYLKLFEEKILTSHKTNYVQYLILYIFSIPNMNLFREKFLSLLILRSFNEDLTLNIRLRFLNYLSSFIASAKLFDTKILIATMTMISDKLTSADTKFRTHIIQSLLYIICYKWNIIESFIVSNKILFTIIKDRSLTYVEESILLEATLLFQKLDAMKYSEDIFALNKALAEQKKVHPIKAYFLFSNNSGYLPIIEMKMSDAFNRYTYRQGIDIGTSTTNSESMMIKHNE